MKNKNNTNIKAKIDILFIADFVPAIGDGASTYSLSILEYLSEKEILVTNKYQEIPALINIS